MIIDTELFRKIPRNDVLFYLHQYKHLNYKIKIIDLYERINKPTYVFCFIIDELVRLKLIHVKNYVSKKTRDSYFPEELKFAEIEITEKGVDYFESMVLGFNLHKYDPNYNPLDSFNIFGFSGKLSYVYQKPFNFFIDKRSIERDPKLLYYLCTGKEFKEDNEKKVFISYSWDSEEHKEWVKKLAFKLAEHFYVEFDKNLKHAMSPTNYMKHNILSSDFVIIVFTPKYLEKTLKDGSGVQFEYSIVQEYLITEELFRKISYGKYLPVLKEGNKSRSIPSEMQDSIYFDFTDNTRFDTEVDILIKHIKDN